MAETNLPQGPFGVILADPPWSFETYSDKGKGRSADRHYRCMDLFQIRTLPVHMITARNCVLYLWATVPHLENALNVLSTWGFGYKSNFVWTKERWGTGYWARNRHEHLLIGTRGSGVAPPRELAVDSVIQGQQREHSRKPDAVYEIIERYHPNVPKVELFARQHREGWTSWGLEVGKFDG